MTAKRGRIGGTAVAAARLCRDCGCTGQREQGSNSLLTPTPRGCYIRTRTLVLTPTPRTSRTPTAKHQLHPPDDCTAAVVSNAWAVAPRLTGDLPPGRPVTCGASAFPKLCICNSGGGRRPCSPSPRADAMDLMPSTRRVDLPSPDPKRQDPTPERPVKRVDRPRSLDAAGIGGMVCTQDTRRHHTSALRRDHTAE